MRILILVYHIVPANSELVPSQSASSPHVCLLSSYFVFVCFLLFLFLSVSCFYPSSRCFTQGDHPRSLGSYAPRRYTAECNGDIHKNTPDATRISYVHVLFMPNNVEPKLHTYSSFNRRPVRTPRCPSKFPPQCDTSIVKRLLLALGVFVFFSGCTCHRVMLQTVFGSK